MAIHSVLASISVYAPLLGISRLRCMCHASPHAPEITCLTGCMDAWAVHQVMWTLTCCSSFRMRPGLTQLHHLDRKTQLLVQCLVLSHQRAVPLLQEVAWLLFLCKLEGAVLQLLLAG